MSIGNLISSLYALAIALTMLMIMVLVPVMLWTDMSVNMACENAARMAAITQNTTDIENEIQTDLQHSHLPTTMNGQTLFTLTDLQTPSPRLTGFYVDGTPSSTETSVTIQYNLPIPFDRALTLIGGPMIDITLPISRTATVYNEAQYTGVSPG